MAASRHDPASAGTAHAAGGHQHRHAHGGHDWKAYFAEKTPGGSPLAFIADHWEFNLPFFRVIRKYVRPGGRILDVGCGPGASAIYLAARGYEVVALDNDRDVLAMLQRNVAGLELPIRAIQADAWEVDRLEERFDLAFSIGVLEHFDAPEFVALLRRQTRVARLVLTGIPTPYTRWTGPVVDERFYSVRELRRLYARAGLRVLHTFGYGDLMGGWPYRLARLALPHGAYRLLQNRFGFAHSIAALGVTRPYAAI